MKRKYILKPGRHQFAPGSPPVHTHDNLSDKEVEWYLEKYPHIAALIERNGEEVDEESGLQAGPTEPINNSKPSGEINKQNEIVRHASVKSSGSIGEINK